MKVLLDTNVLLDIVEKREPFFSASYGVFMKSATKEIDAIIGASLTDVELRKVDVDVQKLKVLPQKLDVEV